jgi:CrcB protein
VETVGKFLAVAAGGALGAIARFAISNSFLAFLFNSFPLPTFFINITGSLLIGFLLTLATERIEMSENLRLFLTVGFLGAYTTFSAFEFEALSLVRAKEFLNAALYVVLSISLGFISVLAGVWLARKI